jgi:hypothetical protein
MLSAFCLLENDEREYDRDKTNDARNRDYKEPTGEFLSRRVFRFDMFGIGHIFSPQGGSRIGLAVRPMWNPGFDPTYFFSSAWIWAITS